MDGSHSTENFPTLQQELNATVTLKVILGKFDLKFVIGNQTTIVLTWDTGISDIYNVLATCLTGYIQIGKLKTRKPIDSNYLITSILENPKLRVKQNSLLIKGILILGVLKSEPS